MSHYIYGLLLHIANVTFEVKHASSFIMSGVFKINCVAQMIISTNWILLTSFFFFMGVVINLILW